MSAKKRDRFDIDALRKLAGDKVFARGEAYFGDEAVDILSLARERVLARVAGTEDYRVEIAGRGSAFRGDCSCPAFSDWGFCKHLVATALAANAVGARGDAESIDHLAGIRKHLKAKGIDALVAIIMEQAEQDTSLFRKLEIAAAAAQSDDKTLDARLRKAIDAAIRIRGFIDYREAASWAGGVDAALDTLAELASGGRGGLVLPLVERAIDRIEAAVASIDNSDGHCTALLERAQDIHLSCCRAVKPDPAALARNLFTRQTEGEYHTFGNALARYEDVLGKAGFAEYRRLAAAAWSKVVPRKAPRRGADNGDIDNSRLAGIMDYFAARDGDVEARVAIRARKLSSSWAYLQLAEFCRAQGREEEALRRGEEGIWMFEDDRPDERLVFFVVELLTKAGRKADAQAHLWRAFEKAPSLELYARLRKLGGGSSGDRAREMLEARLVNAKPTQWHHPSDLLVRILTVEKRFDAAWAIARKNGASASVRETLARASEASHPRDAVKVYEERVEALVMAGGRTAYDDAVKLVARISALHSGGERSAYLAGLRLRHGRKRNFIKHLAVEP